MTQQDACTLLDADHQKVERLFKEFDVPFADDPVTLGSGVVVSRGNLAQGFAFDDVALDVISEWDLFEPPTSTRIGPKKPERLA